MSVAVLVDTRATAMNREAVGVFVGNVQRALVSFLVSRAGSVSDDDGAFRFACRSRTSERASERARSTTQPSFCLLL